VKKGVEKFVKTRKLPSSFNMTKRSEKILIFRPQSTGMRGKAWRCPSNDTWHVVIIENQNKEWKPREFYNSMRIKC